MSLVYLYWASCGATGMTIHCGASSGYIISGHHTGSGTGTGAIIGTGTGTGIGYGMGTTGTGIGYGSFNGTGLFTGVSSSCDEQHKPIFCYDFFSFSRSWFYNLY